MKKSCVTLEACRTAEGLAMSCHEKAGHWWGRCPVGLHFDCPLATLGDGRCAKVTAQDWEAVMTVEGARSQNIMERQIRILATELARRRFVPDPDACVVGCTKSIAGCMACWADWAKQKAIEEAWREVDDES